MKLAAIVVFIGVFTLPMLLMLVVIFYQKISGKQMNLGWKYPTGPLKKRRSLLIIWLYYPVFVASLSWLVYVASDIGYALAIGLTTLTILPMMMRVNSHFKKLPQPPTEGFKDYQDRLAWHNTFTKAWAKDIPKFFVHLLIFSIVIAIVIMTIIAIVASNVQIHKTPIPTNQSLPIPTATTTPMSASTQIPPTSTSESWNAYTNEIYGYSISYPGSWYVVGDSTAFGNDPWFVMIYNLNSSASVFISSTDALTTQTLEEYISYYITTQGRGFDLISSNRLTDVSWELLYLDTDQNKRYLVNELILSTPEHLYQVMARALPSEWGSYSTALTTIIHTLKLTTSDPTPTPILQ